MSETNSGVVGENEQAFLETVRKRYKLCIDAERDNRDRAREALRFRDLEQWDDKTRSDRENDPEGARPCLVVDKLNQHVQQVVNDERLNRPQIKVRPVDDKGDVEVAKIYDGIIRHIQDSSHADIAYDTAFEAAVDGGFGFWRILTEYCDPMSFDQDIRIKRIRNRFSTYLDPARQEPDGSDAEYGFILYRLQRDDFKSEFGKKAEEALESFAFEGREFTDWYGDDWVIYAEYFWKDKKREKIVMLADEAGTKMTMEEYQAGPEKMGIPIQRSRETVTCKVRWRKVTAVAILEDGEWIGDRIPIVEVVGTELDVEGKVKRSGLIRPAMDAQRVDNYATSAFVENVALAPRANYVAAIGQIEGNEDLWRSANRRNISVLPYKPVSVDGALVGAPQRQAPPGISQGWLSVLEQSEHNIQAAMGRYNASLGAPSNETSGRAINARNREGDVGSFHYSDNLSRSLRHTGQMIVDIIPKVYDVRRVARIIGEDGTPGAVTLDPNLTDEQGQPTAYREMPRGDGSIEKIYNLGVGKYDVTVVSGPSFTTRRVEAADFLSQIAQGAKDPVTSQVVTYLALKFNDLPGADEAQKMIKKLLPPGIVEDENQQDKAAKLQAQMAKVQEAVKLIGQKEAEINAAHEQAAAVAQEAAQREQAAADALGKVEDKIAELNADKVALDAERQVLAAERREAQTAKQLAQAQIDKALAEAQCKMNDAAMARERELTDKREQELTYKGQMPPEVLGALAEGQQRLADAVVTMTQVMAAERESELLEDPQTGAMRSVSRVKMPGMMQ